MENYVKFSNTPQFTIQKKKERKNEKKRKENNNSNNKIKNT